MLLVREGKVRLDDRVTRFFHNFGVHGKTYITFRHLLGHYSGLAAWRPFFEQSPTSGAKGELISWPAAEPRNTFTSRSIARSSKLRQDRNDLFRSQFHAAGRDSRADYGLGLHRFCRERIFRPLGLRATDFVDFSLVRTRRLEPVPEMFAATEICPTRKRLLVGEVHDDNAYAMGGASGHAGLFGPVKEVDRVAAELIACYHGRSDLVPRNLITEFWKRNDVVKGSTWALGWDTPTAGHSSAGTHFSPAARGPSGLYRNLNLDRTGTRDRGYDSHQSCPSAPRQRGDLDFRPLIHDRIMEVLDGPN